MDGVNSLLGPNSETLYADVLASYKGNNGVAPNMKVLKLESKDVGHLVQAINFALEWAWDWQDEVKEGSIVPLPHILAENRAQVRAWHRLRRALDGIRGGGNVLTAPPQGDK